MADETNPFQPGDVVQLKSGGPLFTVSKLNQNGSVLYYYINEYGLIAEHGTAVEAVALRKVNPESGADYEPNFAAVGAM